MRKKTGKGAPKGNKNAVGNKGGKGAPIGNKFALKTGEHATIWLNTLTDEEVELSQQVDFTPLKQIDEEILLLTIRERRMLQNISDLKSQKELAESEIHFKGDRITKQVKYTKLLIDKLVAAEDALTRVQEKKIRAVETKQKLLDKIGLQDNDLTIKIERATNGSQQTS